MKSRLNSMIIHRYFARPKNAGAAFLFAVLALCLPANAQTLTEGDYTYRLDRFSDSVRITRYTGNAADLIIPDTLGRKPVTELASSSFSRNTALQSVSFPSSLLIIRSDVFFDCTGLRQVTIPASVTDILTSPFRGCSALTEINVESSSAHYSAQNGVLFNKDKTTVIQYPGGKSGPYVIPGSVVSIAQAAFRSCGNLTEVTLPAGVDFIGANAFLDCTSLRKAQFEGHAPNSFLTRVFEGTAADFKVQFYEGARRFTAPAWNGYPSESLPVTFPFWRTLYGLAAEAVTAANGDPLLIAYALSFDPEDSAARLPLPVVESGAFRLDFPTDRAGVSLMVERSIDPVSGVWTAAGVTTNSGTGSVSIPLSGSESPEKLYLRFTAAEQME